MRLTPTGLEHSSDSTGKGGISQQCGALSGAVGGKIAPEIAEVVRAWPTLPAHLRASILSAVRQASEGAKR
jgi:hypothetical protein